MPHLFECERCGQVFKDPRDAVVRECRAGVSHGELAGIADARGRSQSVRDITDAMAEVERYDCIVRRVVVSSTAWLWEARQKDIVDEEDGVGGKGGPLFLFGAKVQFDSVIFVWDEGVICHDVFDGV